MAAHKLSTSPQYDLRAIHCAQRDFSIKSKSQYITFPYSYFTFILLQVCYFLVFRPIKKQHLMVFNCIKSRFPNPSVFPKCSIKAVQEQFMVQGRAGVKPNSLRLLLQSQNSRDILLVQRGDGCCVGPSHFTIVFPSLNLQINLYINFNKVNNALHI